LFPSRHNNTGQQFHELDFSSSDLSHRKSFSMPWDALATLMVRTSRMNTEMAKAEKNGYWNKRLIWCSKN
jgi:hypothetical protein